MNLTILIPVLKRPHRVEPVLKSIREATPDAHALFLCDPGDYAEQAAIVRCHAELRIVDGGYAKKINAGVRVAKTSLVALMADDLDFHPGWIEEAMKCLTPGVGVVGVNDMIDRGMEHATHFLMKREYAERPTIDNGPGPLCELYDHSYIDNELIETAKARGAYRYAEHSKVEHLHPIAGKGKDDATYQRGMKNFHQDGELFKSRERLWAT